MHCRIRILVCAKNNKLIYVTSKDSDRPGYQQQLVRVFIYTCTH